MRWPKISQASTAIGNSVSSTSLFKKHALLCAGVQGTVKHATATAEQPLDFESEVLVTFVLICESPLIDAEICMFCYTMYVRQNQRRHQLALVLAYAGLQLRFGVS